MPGGENDKMVKDVRTRLKNIATKGGKYFKGTAGLFLASGTEMLNVQMPVLSGMIETNKDVLSDTARFLRNPVDAINRTVNKALQSEDYKALSKFAKNAVADLKSGDLYDPDRMRSEFGEGIDALLDNFGDFDMSGFDEDGNYTEPEADTEFEKEAALAESQEQAADVREEATLNAIGAATSAVVNTENANAQTNIRLSMKQHSQLMSGLQNVVTEQAATLQAVNQTAVSILDVMREAHTQRMSGMETITSLLTKIEANTAPHIPEKDKPRDGPEIFGSNGEINIKEWLKQARKNADDKFGISSAIGMITGGQSIKQLLENTYNDNPWQMVTDLLLSKIVPDSLKTQMERTNKNLSSFGPALLNKLAERGKRFGSGDDKDATIGNFLAGLFGYEQRSRSTITTDMRDLSAPMSITKRTVQAIEQVIPMWLSRIYSALSGEQLGIYNYSTGQFDTVANVVQNITHSANDLVGRMGSATSAFMDMAKETPFESVAKQKDFENYLYRWLQQQGERGAFIDPWKSEKEFRESMPQAGSTGDTDLYYKTIVSALRSMDRSDLMRMSQEIYEAREARDRANTEINNRHREEGTTVAFSGVLDRDFQRELVRKAKDSQYSLSEKDIEAVQSDTEKAKARASTSILATNTALSDIKSILTRGIITYTYILGNATAPDGTPTLPPGFKEVSKAASDERENLAAIAKRKADAETNEENRKRNQQKEQEAKHREGETQFTADTDILVMEEYWKRTRAELEANIDNPEIERLRREREKDKRRDASYDGAKDTVARRLAGMSEDLNGKLDRTGFKGFLDNVKDITNTPFTMVENGLKMVDSFLFRIIYGEDASQVLLDENKLPSLLDAVRINVKASWLEMKDWFGEHIGEPMKKALFDEKTGIIPRIGNVLQEKVVKPVKEKATEVKDKLIGTRAVGPDGKPTGEYSGGKFSESINRIIDRAQGLKSGLTDDITGKGKGFVSKMLYGDNAESKGVRHEQRAVKTGKMGKIGEEVDKQRTIKARAEGKIGQDEFVMKDVMGEMTEIVDEITGYSGLVGKMKQGFHGFLQMMFGPDEDGNDYDSWNKWNKVKDEVNKAFPDMVIGSGAGLLASFFLPGGPVLGALLGATGGLISGSDSLKKFLFGEFGDEEVEEQYYDSETHTMKTRKRKKRTGGLIEDEIVEGFKKYAPKIGIGAGIGVIGSMFLPGGPLIGGLIGSIGGMTAASEHMKRLIFGELQYDADGNVIEDSKSSGLISENVRKAIKEGIGPALGGAALGAGAWGLISSIGIIPGLSLLPGGPIFAMMGGLMGAMNKDAINNFFFGEEQEVEETQPDGSTKKVKKKVGGLFGRAFDFTRDKVLKPFADRINTAGHKVSDWFHESVIGPFERSIQPLKDRIADAGKAIKASMENIGNRIKESIDNVFEKHVGKPMGEFFKEKVLGPLDRAVSKIFNGIGKMIGAIISAPFKALEFIVTGQVDGKSPDEIREDRKAAKSAKEAERAKKRRERAAGKAKGSIGEAFGHLTDIFTPEKKKGKPKPEDSETSEGEPKKRSFIGNLVDRVTGKNKKPKPAPEATNDEREKLKTKAPETSTPEVNRIENTESQSARDLKEKAKRDAASSDERDKLVDKAAKDSEAKQDKAKAEGEKTEAKAMKDEKSKLSIRKHKSDNEYLRLIEISTRKIFMEIKGQLGGSGWNIAYIKTLLDKKFGKLSAEELPEEMEGSKKVKKRRGFFGRMFDRVESVFGVVKDKIGDAVGGFFDLILSPFKLIGQAIGLVKDAVVGTANAIFGILKTIGPAIAELLKGAAKGIGAAVAGIGKMLWNAAGGIGKALGAVANTLTHVVGDVAMSMSALARGVIETVATLAPDIAATAWKGMKAAVGGIWKGIKFVGKGILDGLKFGKDVLVGGAKWLADKVHLPKLEIGWLGNFPVAVGGDRNLPYPYVKMLASGDDHAFSPTAIPVFLQGISDASTMYVKIRDNNDQGSPTPTTSSQSQPVPGAGGPNGEPTPVSGPLPIDTTDHTEPETLSVPGPGQPSVPTIPEPVQPGEGGQLFPYVTMLANGDSTPFSHIAVPVFVQGICDAATMFVKLRKSSGQDEGTPKPKDQQPKPPEIPGQTEGGSPNQVTEEQLATVTGNTEPQDEGTPESKPEGTNDLKSELARAFNDTKQSVKESISQIQQSAKDNIDQTKRNVRERVQNVKKKYNAIDRAAETSDNPGEAYDKAIRNATTDEDIEAITTAQQLNSGKVEVVAGEAKEEEKKSGILDWLMSLLGLGGNGGIFGTLGNILKNGLSGIAEKLAGTGVGQALGTAGGILGSGLSLGSVGSGIGTVAALMRGDKEEAVEQGAMSIGRFISNVVKKDYGGLISKGIGNFAAGASLVGESMANGAGFFESVAEVASTGNGLVGKILTKISGLVNKLCQYVAKRFPNFAAKMGQVSSTFTSKLGTVLKNVSAESLTGFLKKLGVIITVATTTYDFVSGMTEGARILKIDASNVTIGMRVAAGLAKALSNLAFGLIPVSWLAETIYKLFADDEADAELDAKQAEFKAAADAAGMSLDDYNAQENKTLAQNIGGVVKKVGSTISGAVGAVGGGILDHVKGVGANTIGGIKSILSGDVSGGLKSLGSAAMTFIPGVGFVKMAGSILDRAKNLEGPIGTAATWLSNTGGKIAEGAKNLGSAVVDKAGAALGAAGDWIGEKANLVKDAVGSYMGDVAKSLSEKFNGVKEHVDKFMEDPLGNIRSVFAEKIPYAIGKAAGNISNFFSNAVEKAGEAINDAKEKIGATITNIGNKFTEWKNGVSKFMSEFPDNVVNKANEIVTGISNKITQLKERIGEKFTEIVDAAGAKFTEVKENVATTLTNIGNGLVTGFTNVKNTVTNFVTSIPEKAGNLVNTVSNKVGEAIDAAGTAITSIPGKVKESVDKAAEAVKTAASNAVDKVKDAAGNLWSNVTGFFGDIGSNFTAGFQSTQTSYGKGPVADTAYAAVDNIRNIGERIASAVKASLEPITGRLESMFTSVFDSVKSSFGKVSGAVKNVTGKVVDTGSKTVGTVASALGNGVTDTKESLLTALATVGKGLGTALVDTVKSLYSTKDGVSPLMTSIGKGIGAKLTGEDSGNKSSSSPQSASTNTGTNIVQSIGISVASAITGADMSSPSSTSSSTMPWYKRAMPWNWGKGPDDTEREGDAKKRPDKVEEDENWGTGSIRQMKQSDPKWNARDHRMATTGCGPTVAAMVASKYDKSANPNEANVMSKQLGMRAKDGGTNPKFFSSYASSHGYRMKEGPVDGNAIKSSLAQDRPVVVMGKGGAFGGNTHYMVADRMDSKKSVGLIDPLTGGHRSTSLSGLIGKTSTAVYSWGKGDDQKWNPVAEAPMSILQSFGKGPVEAADDIAGRPKTVSNATQFPKYSLSQGMQTNIGKMLAREMGGTDIIAARNNLSHLANLSEVQHKHDATEEGLKKTLESGWYGSNPYSDAGRYTENAKAITSQAINEVLLQGHRTLPRYVTEYDMFPLDAAKDGTWNTKASGQDRSSYIPHQTQIKQNPNRFSSPATYTFYKFMAKNNTGDVMGYYSKYYDTYKSDVAWSDTDVGTVSSTTSASQAPTYKYNVPSTVQIKNNFPYYLQGDPAWANKMYSSKGDPKQTMKSSACGPTSMAMVLRSYGVDIDPPASADWSLAHGYRTRDNGTSGGFYDAIAKAYGLQSTNISSSNLTNYLSRGIPVVASGTGSAPFTKSGHYVVLAGMKDGGILVNDPNSSKNTDNSPYNVSTITSQASRYYAITAADGSGSIGQIGQNGSSVGGFGAQQVPQGGNPLNKKFGISSHFGKRSSPYTGWHHGIDLYPTEDRGTPTQVLSRFNGTIQKVRKTVPDSDTAYKGSDGSYHYDGKNTEGNYVSIKTDTDDQLLVTNMHLKAGSIPDSIKEGATVKVGDLIGTMGSTGWSTGAHLHYQFEKPPYGIAKNAQGNAVDPEKDTKWGVYSNGTILSSNGSFNGSYDSSQTRGGGRNSATASGDSGSNSLLPKTAAMTMLEAVSAAFGTVSTQLGNIISTIMGQSSGSTEDSGSTYSSDSSYSETNYNGGDSSASWSGGSIPTSISGNDNVEKIWNYLISQGYSPYGAVGLMGCWENESGNQPRRVEGDYTKRWKNLGFTYDKVFSSPANMDDYVERGLWPAYDKNYVPFSWKDDGNDYVSGVKESAYRYNGHWWPGIGLAQWTGGRSKALYDFSQAKGSNWDKLEAQLGYFETESENRGLKAKLNAAKSPADGARIALDNYEMGKVWNADHTAKVDWSTTAKGKEQLALRSQSAAQLYQLLKDKMPGVTTATPAPVNPGEVAADLSDGLDGTVPTGGGFGKGPEAKGVTTTGSDLFGTGGCDADLAANVVALDSQIKEINKRLSDTREEAETESTVAEVTRKITDATVGAYGAGPGGFDDAAAKTLTAIASTLAVMVEHLEAIRENTAKSDEEKAESTGTSSSRKAIPKASPMYPDGEESPDDIGAPIIRRLTGI